MNKIVMPSELQTASAEASKLFHDLKTEWDTRRDAEYEKFFNDPRIVELDEKAHSLRDQVIAFAAVIWRSCRNIAKTGSTP
jgi:hypothetical protein